jgi:tetratricopeptide (TPR) repeat protein
MTALHVVLVVVAGLVMDRTSPAPTAFQSGPAHTLALVRPVDGSGAVAGLRFSDASERRPYLLSDASERRPYQPQAAPAIDATITKADAARDAGEFEEAVELYRKALAARPRWVEGWWNLGTTLYEIEEWAEAKKAFDRLLRLEKEHGAALAFRGLCEFKLADYPAALESLLQSKALGVSGNAELGSVARFHAGVTMTRLGQFELALNTLGEFALEGNDGPQIIEALGIPTLRMQLLPSEVPPHQREMVMMAGRASYFMAMRLAPAARTAFEELTLRYPDVPNVHYAFGVFLLTDDPDRALRQFERELKLQPGHSNALIQMAGEYVKRGDYESARPHAERAVHLAPTDFIPHRLMGQILLETDDVPGAIAALEQSRKLEPNSPSVRFTLAKAYQRAGRADDAERERAEFTRLDRLARLQRSGVSAVGGVIDPPSPP